MVKAIPTGYHSLTPYLIVHDAQKALEFYKTALGAEECVRMDAPDGRIAHAEIKVGNSMLMLADEAKERGFNSARSLGSTPVSLMLYTEDVDNVVQKAIELGATARGPVEDQFYGDRMGTIVDPFGHIWHIATHVEDVSPEEMQRRAKTLTDKSNA
jgi:PhnB protein